MSHKLKPAFLQLNTFHHGNLRVSECTDPQGSWAIWTQLLCTSKEPTWVTLSVRYQKCHHHVGWEHGVIPLTKVRNMTLDRLCVAKILLINTKFN